MFTNFMLDLAVCDQNESCTKWKAHQLVLIYIVQLTLAVSKRIP